MPKLLDRIHLARIALKHIVGVLLFGTAFIGCALAQVSDAAPHAATLNKYCITCHNDKARTGGLSLQSVDIAAPDRDPDTWEKVIRKLRTGAMPPPGLPRPDQPA